MLLLALIAVAALIAACASTGAGGCAIQSKADCGGPNLKDGGIVPSAAACCHLCNETSGVHA